jgi:hypothetical protein
LWRSCTEEVKHYSSMTNVISLDSIPVYSEIKKRTVSFYVNAFTECEGNKGDEELWHDF